MLVSAGQWSFMFRDVILRLRRQFRCLTFDFPGSGLSPDAPGCDHSVRANAQILDGFIDAVDLQDVTMVVHDVGGPLGFLVATRRPERFRALVISNAFGWPLAGYRAVRRTLKVVGQPAIRRGQQPDERSGPVHRQPLRRRAQDEQGRTGSRSLARGVPAVAAWRRSKRSPGYCASTRSWPGWSGLCPLRSLNCRC
jgi:pimeloyl-ACP methyl ester carboxylesterase